MRDQYFSRVYRGWTLQQTDRGWYIVNSPNRDRSGPISPGPYPTFGIAEHVVDRIMDNSYGPKDNPRNQNSDWGNSRNDSYNNRSNEPDTIYYVYSVVIVIMFFGGFWIYNMVKTLL